MSQDNKLNAVLAMLASNQALYDRLIEAVEYEAKVARDAMHLSAVDVLFNPVDTPKACGLVGAARTWSDLLARVKQFKKV